MKTRVTIIGGGPSGLLTSQLLHLAGIETIVLERRSRDYVLGRIRAGVLEDGMADLLRRAGVGARMDAEGQLHDGICLAMRNRGFRVDFSDLVGRSVMVYGQTELTRDLYEARDAAGATILEEVEDVAIHDAETSSPRVTFRQARHEMHIDSDWVIGCDGFHGVSRPTIPEQARAQYERVYPFAWLGALSETPPVAPELIYANHARGFALCSMRNQHLSRYYLQVPADTDAAGWSDDAFWDELRRRIPEDAAEALVTGPTLEKSVAPLRSFVVEPMRWGRLCLVGDAAHIVPPTGAKGLNLAASDVHYLVEGLTAFYAGDPTLMEQYSARALRRVWRAIRFSWWFTALMHRFPDTSGIERKLQEAELDELEASRPARAAMASNYVGPPY